MANDLSLSEPVAKKINRADLLHLGGIFVFVLAGAYIGLFKPFAPGLDEQGHIVLMATLIAVGIWVFGGKWIPIAGGGLVLLLVLVAAGMKYSLVFNGFAYRSLWILIPALFFGFALTATGLGRRIAYWVISLFKPSYLTLTVSWVIISLLLSALTPSITVRIAIVIPIAVALAEICKLQYGSRGSAFILLVAWSMVLIPGTGWLTGSLWGPMGIGFFGSTPGLENAITFNSWIKALLLPALVLTVLFVLLLYKFMKPKENIKLEREFFRSEYQALQPMSFREKATLIILAITFLMLVTAQIHRIPDVAICLGAFILLMALGVIGVKDIGNGISWNLVIFFGAVMGLNAIFQESGVSGFLGKAFTPLVSSLAVHPWLFLFIALVFLFLWRFLDVTQLFTTMAFLLPFMPMLADDFGIHPLVFFSIVIMAGNCFFTAYQQPFVIAAESIAGKASWTAGQLRKAGILYFAACLMTLAVCIPYWMAVGLIR
jgi:anion transporter